MYLGHVALGLGATRTRPGVPVLVLALAAIAPDVGDIVLGIAGVHGPWHYTHTVPAACAWAACVGLAGLLGYGRAGALVLAALTATHVPLDYLTSRLDLWSGGPVVGLQLYARPILDFALEGCVILGGWLAYRDGLPAAARNRWPAIAIATVMLAFQAVFNLVVG